MPSACARQRKFGQILGLHEDDGLRLDGRQRADDAIAPVNGIVNFDDVRGQMMAQFGHPGGCGGGHDDGDIGQARLQCADELRAEIDFADADGVEPDDVTVRDRLHEVCIKTAEALKKTGKPAATPPHSHEVIRRRQHEKNREQNVVKCSHSNIPTGNGLFSHKAAFHAKNVSRE